MHHILLVEDDVFLREMYVHVFEKEGDTIVQAEDGDVAITKAAAEDFDLILLDIMLPKKSGIEVLQALRQPGFKAEHTPVLLLSNLGQSSVIEQAYTLGANGYILKADLLPQQVLDKVHDFLAGKLTEAQMRQNQSMD